jgi:hypothetical protein
MASNWLVGRAKNQEVGEEEDLMVPPSSALAGKMYTTLMSQVTAGKKHGGMNEVDGVKFDLKKSEISQLDKIGLVPMVNEYGKVMAFSAKTLFNGDNLGLQTYSVVRVFYYINKVLIDFLNRRAFENWTSLTEKDLREQIVKFLDRITGPSNLIEKFKILRFERDENQKDRIFLDIHITPYFPAKSFMLKLDGTKGDDGTNWSTETKQAAFQKAFGINKQCALNSTSFGIYQVLGSNFSGISNNPDEAVRLFNQDPVGISKKLVEAWFKINSIAITYANNLNFAKLAEKYNGPLYAQNNYDVYLAAAYEQAIAQCPEYLEYASSEG